MSSTSRLMPYLLLLAGLVTLLLATPATAQSSWQLRVGGLGFDTDGGSKQNLIDGEAETSIKTDFGFTATAEYRFNRRIGLEFGAMLVGSPEIRAQIDSSLGSFTLRDEFDMHMFGAGINFHLTPDSKADLYLGPFVGHTIFSDLLFVISDDDARFSVGDEMAFGAVIGIDIPIGDHWTFNSAARYFDVEIEPRNLAGVNADPIDLETVALSLGIGYRF